MAPLRHYTQEPSQLAARRAAGAAVEIHGGGFVTREMLGRTLAQWVQRDEAPPEILVDLRDVAGYEEGCARMAAEWLRRAHRLGVRKIAFVASSTVLRTATRLAATSSYVRLRTFEHERAARTWLARDDSEEPALG
jgi:hypothetical protein